jgi:hypothetical protein
MRHPDRLRIRRRGRLLWGPAALALWLGCGGDSEEDIRTRFRNYVAGANQCEVAADCTAVVPGCPLGCFVAVRLDRKTDVENQARVLLEEEHRSGRQCEYSCPDPGPVSCIQNRCNVSPDLGAGAADAGPAGDASAQ